MVKTLARISNTQLFILAAIVIFAFLPDMAHASTSGGGLPWDSPLKTLADSFTGPVAYTISVLSLVVCFGMLAFGGQLNDATQKIFMVVLIISGLVFIVQLLTSLFGVSGAVI